MNIELERQAFEAWAKTQGDKWLIVGGLQWSAGTDDYASARTNAAWAAWQERAALSARPAQTEQQPVVPEGWKLVPINPSLEMIAALGFGGDELLAVGHGAIFADIEQLWRTALDAAPIAQTAPRCQCCGYLVTDSEHRGCLRAATPAMDAKED